MLSTVSSQTETKNNDHIFDKRTLIKCSDKMNKMIHYNALPSILFHYVQNKTKRHLNNNDIDSKKTRFTGK